MEFFHLLKASQKSGKKDAVIWFTAKSAARANLQLDVALEEAGIEETGRGKDYAKPIRTDFPVYNDLPEEGTIDYTWCDRYELADDQRTWNVIPGVASKDETILTPATSDAEQTAAPETTVDLAGACNAAKDEPDHWFENGLRISKHDDGGAHYPVCKMPFRKQLLAQLTADELRHHITRAQNAELHALEMDTDNSYVQNLLLAAENCEEIKGYDTKDLWRYTNAIRKVFSQEKRHELALVLRFTRIWAATDYIGRGILAREWAAGNRISNVQRTDTGTNADGGYVTDRGENAHHTLDTLDLEIACALLPMDFNHLEIPGSIHRRAKETVANKEEPWKSWSKILRNQPGVLAVNRAAIFNLVRIAPENIHLNPVTHLEFVNQTMTAEFNAATELLPLPAKVDPEVDSQFVDRHLAADRGEFVEGISDPADPKWIKEDLTGASQPQVANLGSGMFSIEGLMNENQPQTDDRSLVKEETTSDVQMETTQPEKVENTQPIHPGEGADAADSQTVALNPAEVLAAAAPELANATQPEVTTEAPVEIASAPDYPAYFEPGRYEDLPNNVYHAANGISSTQVKDARVSLMYFNARHVAKTIPRAPSKVLDMGNLVHALALQPENLDEEFSIEPTIPEGAFTTTATLRAFIDEHNASLPALLSADDIKALLEEYNATLPAQVPMGGDKDAIGLAYLELPAEFKRIVGDDKNFTATAMKACIKEYNATLPAPVKTSGSRDALLEQLAIINPDLVAQEAQKPSPLKVSGTKAEMIQAVKSVKPDAVFADELLDAWRDNPGDKILVTQQQMQTALAIQKALHEHPTAGKLLLHPDRAVETSYFGIDEETGLEIRVRPDIEIPFDMVRVGADLKTISMWNVKQSGLRTRLHREIIDRDYHLSAAMYMQTAGLDQFFWIFVNKDEGYHWIAIVEASEELIELGMLEYRQTMNRIANAFDTGEWPAPITEDYTDELNDFDLRRLEALRLA
ncbi:TPA: PD-(D/E)XK nuclease-like domain-containing protein [Enterobacter roggenkampii]|uniref:RecE family exodeoxyribonuclease n=1 Tax=Enterobacter roggenkampii TaxID=1812935 RepID=UPI003BEAA10F|nr:PD-(D/E)XK nuclease-like domain-containing protein [Enterobacter roggenkampii]